MIGFGCRYTLFGLGFVIIPQLHMQYTTQVGKIIPPFTLLIGRTLRFFLVSVLLVSPLLRYRAPHTAPGVRHVAGVPRDDVDVEVHHRLAGGSADIRADVVAVGVEPVVEESGEGEVSPPGCSCSCPSSHRIPLESHILRTSRSCRSIAFSSKLKR